jgi:TIM-barrel protein
MNVLSAMAGINDGEFCKQFTRQGIDLITLGGFNMDLPTFKAGLENMTQDRKEFFTCPHHISEDITDFINIIREDNPSWKGKISVNLRATSPDSFGVLYNNEDIDIFEINAHCRQEPMLEAGTGQALLKNTQLLADMLEELTTNCDKEIGVKVRANVENVDLLSVVEIIESYNVKYLHVDATNPGVDEADYDILNKVCSNTSIHVIGNNSVTTHQDYLNMINNGADSVSVARAALTGNISHIFE